METYKNGIERDTREEAKTCAQVAFTKYHPIVSRELSIPDDELLVCGMSLGHADDSRIENTLATEREAVESFTTFHDSTEPSST